MKKVIFKTVEFLTGAKVHASHTAIKGNKSGGQADMEFLLILGQNSSSRFVSFSS